MIRHNHEPDLTRPDNLRRITVAKLGSSDLDASANDISRLSRLIAENDDMYPGIECWFASKVLPGIRSGERIAYVAYENETPTAVSILRMGKSAKVCHLRVSDGYKSSGLADLLFVEMVSAALPVASYIHFTLPESLWDAKKGFFGSFGFTDAVKTPVPYRKGESEFACSAPISTVWHAARSKLSKLCRKFCLSWMSSTPPLLLSVKPIFADAIISGSKRIEIRKRFPKKWEGSQVYFYASRPKSALVGKGEIGSIVEDTADLIWERFGRHVGCSQADFYAYLGDAQKAVAVEMKNVSAFHNELSRGDISISLSKNFVPPQSYCSMEFGRNEIAMRATHLADLLNSNNTREKISQAE